MKTLLLFLLFPFFTFSQLPTDKVAHFGVGYVTGATVTAFTPKQKPIVSISASLALGMLLGAGKEFYDYKDYGKFDVRDMLWTGVGSGLGSVTVRIGINQYQKK